MRFQIVTHSVIQSIVWPWLLFGLYNFYVRISSSSVRFFLVSYCRCYFFVALFCLYICLHDCQYIYISEFFCILVFSSLSICAKYFAPMDSLSFSYLKTMIGPNHMKIDIYFFWHHGYIFVPQSRIGLDHPCFGDSASIKVLISNSNSEQVAHVWKKKCF